MLWTIKYSEGEKTNWIEFINKSCGPIDASVTVVRKRQKILFKTVAVQRATYQYGLTSPSGYMVTSLRVSYMATAPKCGLF